MPYAIWSPHFETELEIIQNYLDDGGRVHILGCNGELKTCEPNPTHDSIICAKCKSRFQSGIKWLSKERVIHENFFNLDFEQSQVLRSLENYTWDDEAALRSFEIEGADLGLATLSSLVTYLRDPKPDLSLQQELVQKNIANAVMVYFSLKNIMARIKPSALLICNGRFSSLRPAVRAAQKQGITAYIHEVAGDSNRYTITVNNLPQDLGVLKKSVENVSLNCRLSIEDQAKLALSWFKDRKFGKNQIRYHYSQDQQLDLLPEGGLSKKKVNVVVFDSSEDELVAIEGWSNPFYRDQLHAIDCLMRDLSDDSRFQFFLRVHPNLKDLNNSQTIGIQKISELYPNLITIPAESAVSSYALIDKADVVISYGSTVGIEAAYSGTPSILMGRAVYEDLQVCICPKNHDELIALLVGFGEGLAIKLPDQHLNGIIKFGLFNCLGGYPFKFVRPFDAFSAKMEKNGKIVTIKSSIGPHIASVLKRFWCQLSGIKKN